MTTTLTQIELPVVSQSATGNLIDTFLSGQKESTRRGYADDIAIFSRYIRESEQLGVASDEQALRWFFKQGAGRANEIAHNFRTHLREQGFAPATINRRLAALRSFNKLAARLGHVSWNVSVDSLKSESYRDTRGPGRTVYEQMEDVLAADDSPKAVRDLAIIRLLYLLALRAGEVVSLRMEDVDFERRMIFVMGKGKEERTPITMPDSVFDAVMNYVQNVRGGTWQGPLFNNMDRAMKCDGVGLAARSVHSIVRNLGKAVGRKVTPHALRHTSITLALELTNGNITEVRAFSRHADLRTVQIYNDRRNDGGLRITNLIQSNTRLTA